MNNTLQHTPGPGLKVLTNNQWYGWGGCDCCGTTSDEYFVPRQVRYWDCDDGWKVGALCQPCGEEAAVKGPDSKDYAYNKRGRDKSIDAVADLLDGDEDGIWAEAESIALFDEFGE